MVGSVLWVKSAPHLSAFANEFSDICECNMALVSHTLLKEMVPMKLIVHVIQRETCNSQRTMSSLATAQPI